MTARRHGSGSPPSSCSARSGSSTSPPPISGWSTGSSGAVYTVHRDPADVRRPVRGQRGHLSRRQDRQGLHDGSRPRRHRGRADARRRVELPDGLPDLRAQPLGGGRAVPRLPAPSDEEPRTPRTAPSSRATTTSLPVDEGDLLVDLNDFVGSVDKESLRVVVEELGDHVRRHRTRRCRRCSTTARRSSREAGHTDETIRLLRTGRTVLRTQSGQRRTSAPSPAT